jgi:phenylacetate-CoA ligase
MIPDIERKSKTEIKKFQEEKLKQLLDYLEKNSPFYQRLFRKHHIKISRINKLEDITRIPVTTKDDIHKFNDDFTLVL